MLRNFWHRHRRLKAPCGVGTPSRRPTVFDDFNDLRRTFGSADHVAPFTVYDVGRNDYRLLTVVHYNARRIYVRNVMTHAEYDRWCID
jgi:mRNA interferase HigB